jgi:ABC-type multidrug transport system ATPase subunit
MSVLEVRGLTKLYAGKAAVEDLTFSVHRGQIFGFLGPNGSGKTTTLGMIFGVIRPTSGEIALFGGTTREALASRRVGGTLEQPNLYPYLTGCENLKVIATIKGLDDRSVAPALEAAGLSGSANREVKTYSLGMKQRLALAGAMLGDPELLIFDEPTNGLDPEGMREIREVIAQLAQSGRTILVSTHLLDEVEKICTHVAILRRGRLQRCGTVKEFTGPDCLFRLCSDNVIQLSAAVTQYEFARNVRVDGDALYLELVAGGPASLSRYLAGRGIYLEELSRQRRTLEQAFLAATGEAGSEESGEAT